MYQPSGSCSWTRYAIRIVGERLDLAADELGDVGVAEPGPDETGGFLAAGLLAEGTLLRDDRDEPGGRARSPPSRTSVMNAGRRPSALSTWRSLPCAVIHPSRVWTRPPCRARQRMGMADKTQWMSVQFWWEAGPQKRTSPISSRQEVLVPDGFPGPRPQRPRRGRGHRPPHPGVPGRHRRARPRLGRDHRVGRWERIRDADRGGCTARGRAALGGRRRDVARAP